MPAGTGMDAAASRQSLLAARKRTLAAQLESPALRGDAACSITCAYIAGALLLGLVLPALFSWWWADTIAAPELPSWLVPEAREAPEGAARDAAAAPTLMMSGTTTDAGAKSMSPTHEMGPHSLDVSAIFVGSVQIGT